MIQQLQELVGLGSGLTTTIFLVFLRIGAAMALLPVVGERNIPQKVRLTIALIYTAVVSTAVHDDMAYHQPAGSLLMIAAATEVVIGLALGFGLRAFVFALQMAGSMVAQSTSLSQVFGGASIDPQPAIGHLLLVSGLALAVTLGLHVKIAALLIFSFEILEPGQLPDAGEMSTWGLWQISSAFALAFSLAGPFILASLIYNIALGAINKAMPQLMVTFVGAPAITIGGMILLLACSPLMLSIWHAALDSFFADPLRLAP